MNIQYAIEFVTLAETCNFSIAADQLFISQSLLSKHVMQLEATLGVSLFDRSTRNVTLTAAGEAFLPYAREFSNLWQNVQKTLGELHGEQDMKLSIGALSPTKCYHIPQFINQFYQKHPAADIVTKSINNLAFREKLLNGSMSFAFVPDYTLDTGDDSFEKIVFSKDSLDAVVASDHPLADREAISLEELKDDPYIGLPPESPIYRRNALAFSKAGFEPNTALRFGFFEDHVDSVKQGLGYALSLRKPHMLQNDPEIRYLRLEPPTEIFILLVYPRKKHFSQLEKDFISAARAFSKDHLC